MWKISWLLACVEHAKIRLFTVSGSLYAEADNPNWRQQVFAFVKIEINILVGDNKEVV